MAVLKKSKAWKEFSWYVRSQAKGQCYTCPKKADPREMDAGHRYHNCSIHFFDLRFVRCQCTQCNRFKHGNLGVYEQKLIGEFGLKEMQKAYELSHGSRRWTPAQLEEIRMKYAILNGKNPKEKKVKECPHKLKPQYCSMCMPRKKKK